MRGFLLKIIIIFSILATSCKQINLDILENNASLVKAPNTVAGEEWVEVPANAGGMGLPSFYVMKYEAKAMLESNNSVSPTGSGVDRTTHRPISIAENQPWRSINANDAAAECESLGSGYHLISNPEWMAIARDIENQGTNWTGGSVGSGCLFRGNSGEVTTGDGTNIADSCGYDAATDPDSGAGRDLRAKHTLSNGQSIYDLSGNVRDWVDWDKDTVGFQSPPDTSSCSSAELPSVSCGVLVDADYNTSNGSYTTANGVGNFNIGSGGAIRGGRWGGGLAGVFRIEMHIAPTTGNGFIGFRCVYRP